MIEAQENEALLKTEYIRSIELENLVQQLRATALESAEQLRKLQAIERELVDKTRDQVSMLCSFLHLLLKAVVMNPRRNENCKWQTPV
jgi:hypothetical protein